MKTAHRPDLEHVLATVTVLVNTGPPATPRDELTDADALQSFVHERLITEVEPPTESDLAPVRRLRSQFRTVFAASDDVARTEIVNRLLAAARVSPRLADHDGLGVHLHFFPSFASLEEHLLADCSMALATLLASGEGNRLRICGAPDCARVLVDYSRNRSRVFCDSGRCGNRVNAAAFRERQRQSLPDGRFEPA